MNTAMVSFNTAVRQMTDMFQWPKCLRKKKPRLQVPSFIGMEMPFANLALHGMYVFLV